MTISLITVCYNSAAVIRTALESVLAQTWPEIEYLVIDGGSTDGTVEILREYEERFEGEREGFKGSKVQRFKSGFRGEGEEKCSVFSMQCSDRDGDGTAKSEQGMGGKRMRWVSEKDDGMYDAINKGIRMATGEVVGLLNADDVLEDDRVVERIAKEFLATGNTKIDVVYGDVRFVKNCVNALMRDCVNKAITQSGNKAFHQCVNALMPECVNGNALMPECSNKAITQSGNNAFRHSGNKAFPQCGSDLEALRKARTVRYYSARHWRPWMLRWGFMPPHPSVYIRREWFERLGFYKTDYQIAADYELLIRYLWKAGLKSVYVPACFVTMRMGGKSTKGWRSNLLLNREKR